jgi:hypothetical protein
MNSVMALAAIVVPTGGSVALLYTLALIFG